MHCYFIVAICAWTLVSFLPGRAPAATLKPVNPQFIQNGHLKLGIDLGSGGSIFYLSELPGDRNLLNHFDRGRFVQQSYYGAKDGSLWVDKPWRWNPVQGGGYKGEPAKVLKSVLEGNQLSVASRPKHWATGEDVNEATLEESIDLTDRLAHVHYKFTYTGNIDHPRTDQELPAVFVDYALPNLVSYQGAHPWTNDALTRTVPGFPNEKHSADENWAAYVDGNDWGVGVYFPGTNRLTAYRAKANLTAGPEGAACSYFAPLQTLAITRGWVYEYDIYLAIGKVADVREQFRRLRDSASAKARP